ncbi:glycosyltransferase family 2 protein [Roseateles paludis]|uniref:Glycosyltransferase family 2 protein n=1 Tax=Roseateles paludis TaxID=3145238 RepID=A0ABV0G6N4_9BURK
MNDQQSSYGSQVAMSAPVSVCALLTCFNRVEKTMACLAALEVAAKKADVELCAVLVDDGSSDGTAQQVRQRFAWVQVEVNVGAPLFWCRGMHRAMQLAFERRPELLLLLNDDTVLFEDALSTLIDCLAQGGADQRLAIAVGSTCDATTGAQSYGGSRRISRWRPMTFVRVAPTEKPQDLDTFNGNVVLIPTAVVERIGLIDGTFEHAMGDIDYGLRARRAGIAVRLAAGFQGACSNNPVRGTHGDSTLPLSRRWQLMLSRKGLPWRSWARLTRRHAGLGWPLYFAWPYFKLLLSGLSRRG